MLLEAVLALDEAGNELVARDEDVVIVADEPGVDELCIIPVALVVPLI